MTTGTPAPISVPTAIILGLAASFIQSLGLTIQRKSHLQNEALPASRRITEWKRPLWLIGFTIFLCANIGGTVFQIGALPIVMLAPLGAVSLLYNALLARFLLNDFLSKYMVIGTLLIATGAILIGYFGVVPSPPHSLDELLDLYSRPTFVAFATIFTFLFIGVLAVSHLTEWQLEFRLQQASQPPPRPKTRSRSSRSRLRRRWSAPTLAPVAEVSENSSGISTPVLAQADDSARNANASNTGTLPRGRTFSDVRIPDPSQHRFAQSKRDYGTISRGHPPATANGKRPARKGSHQLDLRELLHDYPERIDAETVRKTRLALSVAYGGASGTMSGACLLLAKSGVELLLLSLGGDNQFRHWQSWMLIFILLAAALLQLWYLNKALKLSDPTLVCPLAFCFYNTSSIALGLVYFDQLGALAWYDILAVILGTAVLLTGVWIVSLHGNDREDVDSCTVGDFGAPILSPQKTESSPVSTAEDIEGLLAANAAGIAGPHLPSPGMASTSTLQSGSSASNSPSSSTASPLHSPVSARPPVHRRRASAHQRRPTITLEFPLREDMFGSPLEDLESPGGRRPGSGLYNTILEHGLSIGLSPSSPGFHLQPRSPHSTLHGHPRRSMSEADVHTQRDDEDDSTALHPPHQHQQQLTRVLAERLERIRQGSKKWFSFGRIRPQQQEASPHMGLGLHIDETRQPLLSNN